MGLKVTIFVAVASRAVPEITKHICLFIGDVKLTTIHHVQIYRGSLYGETDRVQIPQYVMFFLTESYSDLGIEKLHAA
jgi:hypothetical protein